MSVDEIIRLLDLAPHPEGGYFRETFRDVPGEDSSRAASTAIYFLLPQGQVSRWHRVDACEVWHWYGGSPLQLSIKTDDQDAVSNVLAGRRPSCRRATTVRRSALRMAAGAIARRLDACRLHGCARLRVFGF